MDKVITPIVKSETMENTVVESAPAEEAPQVEEKTASAEEEDKSDESTPVEEKTAQAEENFVRTVLNAQNAGEYATIDTDSDEESTPIQR